MSASRTASRHSGHFNPRPPCGGRRRRRMPPCPLRRDFNPRPPCGGRLGAPTSAASGRSNFNPRPPCGGRHYIPRGMIGDQSISIHAPRAGGDQQHREDGEHDLRFQSTPPVRGATTYVVWHCKTLQFQSTPPVRGATCGSPEHTEEDHYFNPRPPCGGRRRPRPGLRST